MPSPRSIPRLWAVTDRGGLGNPSWEGWCAWLQSLGALGIDALQLREKGLDDHALHALAVAARRALAPPALFVLNRRLDLALAAEADGVHLPADGLPVRLVRRASPAGFLIGRSTHSIEEIRAAREEGADYVFFGPVLPTPSKGDPSRAHGISSLRAAAAEGLPVIAIGGMDADTAPEAIAAGAWGAAAIRAFQDPEVAARIVAAVAATVAGRPGG